MQGINEGLCIWGKMGEAGKVLPDVRIRLTEGELDTEGRTGSGILRLRIDVYGAPQGVEARVEAPDGVHSFVCTLLSETPNGGRRHLECVVVNEREGRHRLRVHADGLEGSTVEEFSWAYVR
ncbi:MAG: hypothetical protein FWC28_03075 [Proteobacteria bacterium]|nr:hypothetical protein [Cystobacterineae bacterium]MCL2258997.1 hypothetical protein [Cystobacterineae bacterium]MCL2314220.1 hypothetical protein [Pseudomonadota bacterium]